MFNKKESEPRIKWTASDEKFERKEGNDWVKYTVGSYFEKIYDINLRFPNMPIGMLVLENGSGRFLRAWASCTFANMCLLCDRVFRATFGEEVPGSKPRPCPNWPYLMPVTTIL